MGLLQAVFDVDGEGRDGETVVFQGCELLAAESGEGGAPTLTGEGRRGSLYLFETAVVFSNLLDRPSAGTTAASSHPQVRARTCALPSFVNGRLY
jgi:hypothetical protein